MKRIKIMLTAITIFAVVGGALAFKAKKFGKVVYTTTNPVAGATCPYPWLHVTTINVSNTPPTWLSTVQGGTCILTYTSIEQ